VKLFTSADERPASSHSQRTNEGPINHDATTLLSVRRKH